MAPRRANGLVGDPPASPPQRQQLLNDPGSPMTTLPLIHSLPHELSQHRTLVLAAKRLVERFLHIGRHTKVHCSHSKTPVVEYFNNRMTVNDLTVKIEEDLQQLDQEEMREQRHVARRVASFNGLAICDRCLYGRLSRVGQRWGLHCTPPSARE
jgi:hypothetical protein